MAGFGDLGISKELLEILKEKKIVLPTEIQIKAIPFVFGGRDVVGISATGSGKTLVFAIPLIEKLVPNKNIQALVLTPTRELAEQVASAIKSFTKKDLRITSIYGGVPIESQIRKLKNTDIVVGTPGRILDHLNRSSLNLGKIKVLVLDEFDRMLDMGFHKDVDKIIGAIPRERQTLLFSATTSGVEHLIDKYTKNSIEIFAENYVDHSKLKQIFYDVPSNLKFSLLVDLLRKEQKEQKGLVIVFCSTRRNVDFVSGNLNLNKISTRAIHGGMEQKKRIKVLKEFQEGKSGILVCTDVAARGLDIKGISQVYNYDLPVVVDDYVHRIGRTARAGEKGTAITILCSRDYELFSNIVNQKNLHIQEKDLPYVRRVIIDKDFGQKNLKKGFGRRQNDARGRSSGSGNGIGRSVQMYDAVCMKCGKNCKVPFKPIKGKGISCSNCFVKKDSGRSLRRHNSSFNKGRRSRRQL